MKTREFVKHKDIFFLKGELKWLLKYTKKMCFTEKKKSSFSLCLALKLEETVETKFLKAVFIYRHSD